MKYDYDVVWMTSGDRGTPHKRSMLARNIGITCHTYTAKETGYDGWRNCDRNIRDFWRVNKNNIKKPRVLFLEYDVLVRCDLYYLFDNRDFGLEGPNLVTEMTGIYGVDVDKLPANMRVNACCLSPVAALMISRNVLDVVCDPKYDDLFALDISSELRLPSTVRDAGFSVVRNLGLKEVQCRKRPKYLHEEGIFHPVK